MPHALTDGCKRRIDYLRLSITDRCNLRCTYCMPTEGIPKLFHDDMLRYEEILRLARIVVGMGITKVRITGGEPLVRKDVLVLCRAIAQIPGLESLSLTTNGVLLADYADELAGAGIQRVNVSLDTLNRDKFQAITRRDALQDVWRGIEAADRAGLRPVKLNVVVMHGINDDEIEDLARLTLSHSYHVRFIEFMPFKSDDFERRYLSCEEILTRLRAMGTLDDATSRHSNGPARYFRLRGGMGKIGLISPISHHFCPACNRLRLTSDGKLRTCLFASVETDLRTKMREGASDDVLVRCILDAVAVKPKQHELDSEVFRKCIGRPMVSIGG
ncbi:MAG: GTP 3',8-cyclase MoaA [Syntrophobacteraceae bacterium]